MRIYQRTPNKRGKFRGLKFFKFIFPSPLTSGSEGKVRIRFKTKKKRNHNLFDFERKNVIQPAFGNKFSAITLSLIPTHVDVVV